MRCSRKKRNFAGCAAAVLGVIILLALILPAGFWWFAVGTALIVAGLLICVRC